MLLVFSSALIGFTGFFVFLLVIYFEAGSGTINFSTIFELHHPIQFSTSKSRPLNPDHY
jgi:hypothetical protein